MSIVEAVGAAVEGTEAFIHIVQELNGSRSAVIQVHNDTKVELRRVQENHIHGVFAEPASHVIPPQKSDDVFSMRERPGASTQEPRAQSRMPVRAFF